MFKYLRCGQFARVKLGVSAGQKDEIGVGGRGFVGERREGQNFSPSIAPVGQDVWIGEGKRLVRSNRDPLTRRCQACRSARRLGRVPCQSNQRVQIKRGLDHICDTVQIGLQVGMFLGLHQSQMARGVFQT